MPNDVYLFLSDRDMLVRCLQGYSLLFLLELLLSPPDVDSIDRYPVVRTAHQYTRSRFPVNGPPEWICAVDNRVAMDGVRYTRATRRYLPLKRSKVVVQRVGHEARRARGVEEASFRYRAGQ